MLNDVTATQVSSVWELKAADPTMSAAELFRVGMRIGRDHIGSTVNTLVLAYAGGSLPLFVLMTTSSQGWSGAAGAEVVAEEIVRTLVGSIGLAAAVPITTALAAYFASGEGGGAAAAGTRSPRALSYTDLRRAPRAPQRHRRPQRRGRADRRHARRRRAAAAPAARAGRRACRRAAGAASGTWTARGPAGRVGAAAGRTGCRGPHRIPRRLPQPSLNRSPSHSRQLIPTGGLIGPIPMGQIPMGQQRSLRDGSYGGQQQSPPYYG